jgi:hypothetical protein
MDILYSAIDGTSQMDFSDGNKYLPHIFKVTITKEII